MSTANPTARTGDLEGTGDSGAISQDHTDSGTLAGIIIVIFLGGVILFIMVYHRYQKRLKRLKTELAHVHYHADPSTQPGKI